MGRKYYENMSKRNRDGRNKGLNIQDELQVVSETLNLKLAKLKLQAFATHGQ